MSDFSCHLLGLFLVIFEGTQSKLEQQKVHGMLEDRNENLDNHQQQILVFNHVCSLNEKLHWRIRTTSSAEKVKLLEPFSA